MKKVTLLGLAVFFSAALLVSESYKGQAYSAQENQCLACHAELKQKSKSTHAAMGMGCSTCHKNVEGKSHPAEKGSITLKQPMPGICYSCHDESKFKGKSSHSPVPNGMCTGCHNPHKSAYPKLLEKDIPGLCFNCHAESKFRGNSGHTKIGMCNGCHEPHSSKSDKLLKGDQPGLCYTCHDQAGFKKKYDHAIIATGGCTACHTPHTSTNPSLLTNNMQDLCLSCHVGKSDGKHVVSLPGKKEHPITGVDPASRKRIKVPDPRRPGKEMEVFDPNDPGREMNCVTCHNPHSSDYRNLFVQEKICDRCHKYY